MGQVGSGLELLDTLWSRLGGLDGADRTWAMYPQVKTLRGIVGTATAAGSACQVAIGSPTLPTNPFGGSAVTTQFRVVGWRVQLPAALTAHDTDYATLTLNHYTSAGGSATAVGAMSTTIAGTGNLAAYEVETGSVTAANALMPAGGTLGCVITKAGSGVAIPAQTVIEVDVVPIT